MSQGKVCLFSGERGIFDFYPVSGGVPQIYSIAFGRLVTFNSQHEWHSAREVFIST